MVPGVLIQVQVDDDPPAHEHATTRAGQGTTASAGAERLDTGKSKEARGGGPGCVTGPPPAGWFRQLVPQSETRILLGLFS